MKKLSMWCAQVTYATTPWSKARPGTAGCARKRKDALRLAHKIVVAGAKQHQPKLKARVVRRVFDIETAPNALMTMQQKSWSYRRRAEFRGLRRSKR